MFFMSCHRGGRLKIEIEGLAPVAGTVKAVAASVGTAVNTDDLLVTLG